MRIPRRARALRLLGLIAVAVAPPLAAQRPDSVRTTAAAPVPWTADSARADPTRADPTRAPAAPYRAPRRARVLGTGLPGAGHVYAGEYLRGYASFAGTVGGLVMGPAIYSSDRCNNPFNIRVFDPTPCTPGPRWPFRVAGALLTAGGAALWVASARDAPRAAERANARHRRARVAPLVVPPAGPGGGAALGLAVQWR